MGNSGGNTLTPTCKTEVRVLKSWALNSESTFRLNIFLNYFKKIDYIYSQEIVIVFYSQYLQVTYFSILM
jgi:hypothetical protein